MRPGLLLLVIAVSAGAVGYLEIRHQAAREEWRAEAIRLTGRLEQAERKAEESEEALSSVDGVRRRGKEAQAELADLEAHILDAAAELAWLESDRVVARGRAMRAFDDLKGQVRALTTIEMDLAAIDQRRRRLERHVETVEGRLQQAEIGAAERQKRAESLDRDIAALAIRRETLQARLKTTETALAKTALAVIAKESTEAKLAAAPKAPDPAPAPTPVAAKEQVATREPIDEYADVEERDRPRGLYQFGSLSAEPEAAGGQGGLPPPSQGLSDALDREDSAGDWAENQYLMGLSLLSKAEQSSSSRELNDAVLAFKAVLGEWSKARDPMRWAITRSDLGYALALLGKRQRNASVLEQAAAACRDALGTFERSETPLLWAAAQHHLGVSLGGLAEISGDQKLRQHSIEALEQAIAAFKGAGADTDARMAEKRLRETKTQHRSESAE